MTRGPSYSPIMQNENENEINYNENSKKIDTFLDIIENSQTFKNFITFFTFLCPFIGKSSFEGEIMAYQAINTIIKDDISKINFFDNQLLTNKCMNISRIKNKFNNIMYKFPELNINTKDANFMTKFWAIKYIKEMLVEIKRELDTEIIT